MWGILFKKATKEYKPILDSCLTLSKPHYIERLSHFSFTLVNLKRYLHIEQCVLTACIETKINGAWELDWFLNARISSIVLFVMHVRATQESVDWKKCATASTFNEGCFQCIWVLFCWPCLLYHEWTFHMSFKIQFTLWGRRMRTCITDWKTSRRHWENWGNCFWITRMVRIMSNERLLIINMKTWVGVCMQFSILFKDFFFGTLLKEFMSTQHLLWIMIVTRYMHGMNGLRMVRCTSSALLIWKAFSRYVAMCDELYLLLSTDV